MNLYNEIAKKLGTSDFEVQMKDFNDRTGDKEIKIMWNGQLIQMVFNPVHCTLPEAMLNVMILERIEDHINPAPKKPKGSVE